MILDIHPESYFLQELPYQPTVSNPSRSVRSEIVGKEVRKNFFTVRCVEMWNNLPHAKQAVEDLDEFK